MVFENQTTILHYFKITGCTSTLALGENINLMLKDAGIPFEYIRHTDDDWPDMQEKLKSQSIFSLTLPALEVDGILMNKTIPIMRYLARMLGQYGGSSEAEWQYLDALADACSDWREDYRKHYYLDDWQIPEDHFTKVTFPILQSFEQALEALGGPFVLGEKITYVDILIYHNLDDDHALTRLQGMPHLTRLVEALEHRPNLKDYLLQVKQEQALDAIAMAKRAAAAKADA
ncbi:class gamma glutathione S-transferase [Hesseltinella vesiculosa]|uniref:Class gamma glutathione S-transferase n=1 Tax=Hesseltinella vesiculosa TaxID=101127 RepID=A0A1X2GNW7_9FUNG|nr:class gamma glutathione S-transferase [Hesseltinella vesiculosa]